MKRLKFLSVFSLLFIFIFANSCNKDQESPDNKSLILHAFQYEGDYPEAGPVSFINQGEDLEIEAFPGLVTIFFEASVSEEDAAARITSHGGTIVSQIPAVGYYLAEVGISVTSSFINAMENESGIHYTCPVVVAYISSGAKVLDGCGSGITTGEDHSQRVITNLQNCNGQFESCTNIVNVDGSILTDNMLHGIIRTIQQNGNGLSLINISAAGGFNDGSWPDRTPAQQKNAQKTWYYFMRNILHIIGGMDENFRKNLIVTVASGNGNMPLTDMLAELRVDPMNARILDENVLIVSNKAAAEDEKHGNYAPADPDVVVMNNPDAGLGTSYAAPCVLGIIQDIIDSEGISTSEALDALKLSALINTGRLVVHDEVVDMLDMVQGMSTYKGNLTPIPFTVEQGPCVAQVMFLNTPTALWNGTQGTFIMPSDCKVTLVSGEEQCVILQPDHDNKTFQFNLSGTNNSISGSDTRPFVLGQSSGIPVTASFSGAVNIYGDITGTLTFTSFGVQSVTITLFKQ